MLALMGRVDKVADLVQSPAVSSRLPTVFPMHPTLVPEAFRKDAGAPRKSHHVYAAR